MKVQTAPSLSNRSSCGIAGGLALFVLVATASAQPRTLTRSDAVTTAATRGLRATIARADSSSAAAALRLARQYENPVAALGYSESAPQQHYSLEVPLDLWQRRPRITAALLGLEAATLRYTYAQAALAFDADTSYTQALRWVARSQLTERTARDADSLVILATLRRDAGDASELDVQLARVFAGQSANAAASDSLEAVATLLQLQTLVGLRADSVRVVLADTLALPAPVAAADGVTTTLLMAALERDVQAATLAVELERRRQFGIPALSFGFETGDPTGGPSGLLPTVGISLPFPLFNRNRASTQLAAVTRDRRLAELALGRVETAAAITGAHRSATALRARAERSARLVESANRVAALSLFAYREGAATLASVLEAQRSTREALAGYVDDVANAENAAALVRLLSLTSKAPNP